MAVGLAVFSGLFLTTSALVRGDRPPSAVIKGSLVGVLSVASWSLYRRLSRQDDGLVFAMGIAFGAAGSSRPDFPLAAILLIGLVVQLPLAIVCGLWTRARSPIPSTEPSDSPLYDSETDGP